MKNTFKTIMLVSMLVVSATFVISSTSCGNSSSKDTTSQQEIGVEAVSLSGSKYVNLGSSTTLVTIITPNNATNKNVTYSSSNNNIASVDSNGVVRGNAIGKATITVTTVNGSKTAKWEINVVNEDVIICQNATEFGDSLASTYYQETYALPSKIGLAEPNSVGVNKNIRTTELYATISDQEISSTNLIKVDEMVGNDDYSKIYSAIEKAKNLEGKKKIKFNPRIYNVDASKSSSTFLYDVINLKSTYFDGQGATILMKTNTKIVGSVTSSYNWLGYMNFVGCEDVHVNNFTFQQDVPAALTGTVKNYDLENDTITLSIPNEFNTMVTRLKAAGSPMPKCYTEFHPVTLAPLSNANLVVSHEFVANPTISGNEGSYEITLYLPKNTVKSNATNTKATLLYCQYDAPALYMRNDTNGNTCKNMYFENITVNDASGMAFVGSNVDNLYVNRFFLERKQNSEQLVTACADGMHFDWATGDVKISNSILTYSNDDALNIKHGYWYKISSVDPQNKKLTLNKITQNVPSPKVGDHIEIYEESDFTPHNPTKGYFEITSVSGSGASYTLILDSKPAGNLMAKNCRVTFPSQSALFDFHDNIVGYKRNRGLLVQVRNAKIYNNTFTYVGQGSIQAASSLDIFNEATIPQNIEIYNNKFINNNYMNVPGCLGGDIAIFCRGKNGETGLPGTIKDGIIRNNFITRNGNSAITINSTSGFTANDNFFYDVSRTVSSGSQYETVFYCSNTYDLFITDNYNLCTFQDEQSGVSFGGYSTEESFTLVNNTNIDFRKSGEAGPIVHVGKCDKPITIDGDLSDWSSTNAIDIVFDGVSLASGEKTSFDDYKGDFGCNVAKFTYTDAGLAFAFDVTDSILDFNKPYQFWNGDCIEILATGITSMPTADMQIYKDKGAVLQVAYGMDTDGKDDWAKINNMTLSSARSNSSYLTTGTSDVQTVMKKTETGYILETLLPFSIFTHFKDIIDNKGTIDMAIVIADNDRGSRSRIQASNVPHFVEEYKLKSERMPQYLFDL